MSGITDVAYPRASLRSINKYNSYISAMMGELQQGKGEVANQGAIHPSRRPSVFVPSRFVV